MSTRVSVRICTQETDVKQVNNVYRVCVCGSGGQIDWVYVSLKTDGDYDDDKIATCPPS